MDTTKTFKKFCLISQVCFLSVLFILPLSAHAEYYLVAGPCDTCVRMPVRVVHHRIHHSCRTHKIHKVYARHKCIHHRYVRAYPHRRGYVSMKVYYPVPVNNCNTCATPCNACGDSFIETSYYGSAEPSGVYFMNPTDRLVTNGYDGYYADPSMDTGTADNDIY